MSNSRCKQYFIQGDLFLKIYVIGYSPQGESIVFTVEDGTTIIYCGVVDCYKREEENLTQTLLETLKVKTVDFICWTHPHLDHSLGLDDLLDRYVSDQTRIVYPSNLLNFDRTKMNSTVYDILNKIDNILACPKRKKATVQAVSGCRLIHKSLFKTELKPFLFEIWTLTPIDDIIEKRIITGKEDYINDYSISLLLKLGELSFYLAGDIENHTITRIDDFAIPHAIDYLKIPHHASLTSSKLIEWFSIENKVAVCCATQYQTGRLPRLELLNKYKEVANQIYITGKKENSKSHYGVIYSKCNISKNKISTQLKGDAYLFYEYENERCINGLFN